MNGHIPATPTNFSHVLCAVDYSDHSRHALEHALRIAQWYRASLTVLHVLPPYVIAVVERPDERAMREALACLEREIAAARRATAVTDVVVRTAVEIGGAANTILIEARTTGADLVVLGTHGHGGIERVMLGSVAEKVLRKAGCPVLVVPPRVHSPGTGAFKRILCPVDFSDLSNAACDLACSIARHANGKVTLVHAIEWPWVEPPPPTLAELPSDQAHALEAYRRHVTEDAEIRLDAIAAAAQARGVAVDVRVMHGRAVHELLQLAEALPADLIVMGVHGRHAADVALFGFVACRLARTAPCPVLTYRA